MIHLPLVTCDSRSSVIDSIEFRIVSAEVDPIAQSALTIMLLRSFSSSAISSACPSPTSILSRISAALVRPILQGTHLPQLCARHCLAYAAHWLTGQLPAEAARLPLIPDWWRLFMESSMLESLRICCLLIITPLVVY